MAMPTELSKLIQEFARPRCRPDWRCGSNVCRTAGFLELYWVTTPWYDFWHPDLNRRLDYFMFGWTTCRISGIDMLMGLAQIGVSMRFLSMLFHQMTTSDNLPFLVEEIQSYDPSVAATREALFCWLFL